MEETYIFRASIHEVMPVNLHSNILNIQDPKHRRMPRHKENSLPVAIDALTFRPGRLLLGKMPIMLRARSKLSGAERGPYS